MDLIRNILSHFQRNKNNKQTSITINGVTIQQINNNLQQNSNTEPNNEEFIEIEVPPFKKLKKNVNELIKSDTPENNISDPRVSFNYNQTAVSINNANDKIIDLTDNLEVQHVLEVGETAENSNVSEAGMSFDDNQTAVSVNNNANNKPIALTNNPNSYEIQNVLEIGKTTENSSISEARVSFDDNQTAVSVNNKANNKTIDLKNNPNSNEVQNVLEIGETTTKNNVIAEAIIASDDKQTAVSKNNNISHTTIVPNYNKLLIPQNKPDIVTNILTENSDNELALINGNTEENATEFIREFEDVLANVEKEFTLDSEITLDDVNDLINDFRFDSNGEIDISDTESQIPIHIVRKHIDIPTDFIDFTYDIRVESVNRNKPIEINNSNTERDAKIDTTIVTDVNDNAIVTEVNFSTITNDGNTKPNIINENNDNTNANTATSNKTEDYETISLSSDDNANKIDSIYISDSSDSDCGYHSSDFEFITEEEAKRDGLIINIRPDHLKKKEFNAKPVSRQPKIRKIPFKGKNVQAGSSRTLKVPTNGKNDQAEPINPDRKPSHVPAGPSNPVKMSSIVQARPSNPVQRPSNVQARPSNPFQRSSNVKAETSNSLQMPTNVHLGTMNPVQRPSNIQTGPSNSFQMPPNIKAGPSNPYQRPSNVQLIPNYENYRNKYKKPFQYDTTYMNNHIEPQEDGYIDLFRGFHAGIYPMYTRENKSVTPHFANPSRIWYQGVGFDMQMIRGNSSDDEDDEIKDEANETIQKIRSEYPVENRKRRHFK